MPTSIYNALFTGSEPVRVTGLVTAITTLAVTAALHAGRTILLSLLAGFDATLPAATGSGVQFTFMVGIVNTSAQYRIKCGGSDTFAGSIYVGVDNSATGKLFKTVAVTSATITLNGGSTGGATIGDCVCVQDIAAAVWGVSGTVVGTSATTPFS